MFELCLYWYKFLLVNVSEHCVTYRDIRNWSPYHGDVKDRIWPNSPFLMTPKFCNCCILI